MNSADMPLYNDLSAMKERHDTLKMQIHDLQQQLKSINSVLLMSKVRTSDVFPTPDLPATTILWPRFSARRSAAEII